MVTIDTELGRLYVNGKFSYTKQNGDIGDMGQSCSNFTNSFTIRRDRESSRILEGLGLVGSSTSVPYRRIKATLSFNGVGLIRNGWFRVSETNRDNYKVSVIDGNIDIWKMVEDLSISDLDLSETIHEKTPESVVNSWDAPTTFYYRYFLGDYNGLAPFIVSEEEIVFFSNYLIPAINEDYIFRKLMNRITENYFIVVGRGALILSYLTYSKNAKPDDLGFDNESAFELPAGDYEELQGVDNVYTDAIVVDTILDQDVFKVDDNKYSGFTTGYYRLTVDTSRLQIEYKYKFYYDHETVHTQIIPGAIDIIVNNNVVKTLIGTSFTGEEIFLPNQLRAPDELRFVFRAPVLGFEYEPSGYYEIDWEEIGDLEAFQVDFTLERQDVEVVDFAESLENLSARDYLKFVMTRFGLTLFYMRNVDGYPDGEGVAYFMTLEQRLKAPITYLRNKVIERTKETYLFKDYAQRNWLRHKYADADADYADGHFDVGNKNLPKDKDIYTSITYTYRKGGSFPEFGSFPHYKREVKEDSNTGDIEVTYSPEENRFFSVTGEGKTMQKVAIQDVNGVFPPEDRGGYLLFASPNGTTFDYFSKEYYAEIERLTQDTKIHYITFRMSIYEFVNIDMRNIIYVLEEAAYYLINSMQLRGENEVRMELIKIKG